MRRIDSSRAAPAAGYGEEAMPMTISSRAAWALGLGLLGTVALVGPSLAQQKPPEKETLAPAVVGFVDMEATIKAYEKFKFNSEEIKAAAIDRQKQFTELVARGQQTAKEMKALSVGSPEYRAKDDELTKLQAQLQAEQEKAQREFAQRDAESMAQIYREVKDAVEAVAKHKGMTYVVRISNEKVTGDNPELVGAALTRAVVYSDPKADITQWVISTLNNYYKQTRGIKVPAATATPAPNSTAPQTKSRAAGTPGMPGGR
jgi:Skp family chaperone for outer membrane proteins